MKSSFMLTLVGLSGVVLGVVFGFSIATAISPDKTPIETRSLATSGDADDDANTDDTTANAGTDASSAGQAGTDEGQTSGSFVTATGSDVDGSDENDSADERIEQTGSTASNGAEVDSGVDRTAALEAAAAAVVPIESFGCGVATKTSGVVLDASTVLVPGIVHSTGWYVTIGNDEFYAPQALLIDQIHPAIEARAGAATAQVAEEAQTGDAVTLMWADQRGTTSTEGTVLATSGTRITIESIQALPNYSIGGAVAGSDGRIVGVIESVRGTEVVAYQLSSSNGSKETIGSAPCGQNTTASFVAPEDARNSGLRLEIVALLTMQLGENYLSNGEYAEAQAIDTSLAGFSRRQMEQGWDVTANSVVVPIDWSPNGGKIIWDIGLVTHETNQTSKIFCVERTYDDTYGRLSRNSGRSSLLREGLRGWVEPSEWVEEVRSSC